MSRARTRRSHASSEVGEVCFVPRGWQKRTGWSHSFLKTPTPSGLILLLYGTAMFPSLSSGKASLLAALQGARCGSEPRVRPWQESLRRPSRTGSGFRNHSARMRLDRARRSGRHLERLWDGGYRAFGQFRAPRIPPGCVVKGLSSCARAQEGPVGVGTPFFLFVGHRGDAVEQGQSSAHTDAHDRVAPVVRTARFCGRSGAQAKRRREWKRVGRPWISIHRAGSCTWSRGHSFSAAASHFDTLPANSRGREG